MTMKRIFEKKLLLLAIILVGKQCVASSFGDIEIIGHDINMLRSIQDIDMLFLDGGCPVEMDTNCPSGQVCAITIGPCKPIGMHKLNAAPSQLSFSRYLPTANPLRLTITKANEQITLVGLTKEHHYTTVLQYQPSEGTKISYLFIALPTNPSQVDVIKNLPLGLANYLKKQSNITGGAIIKVYKSTNGSSQWTEVATISVSAEINDQIAKNAKIDTVAITQNGDLVLTYKNLKKRDGKIIPTTRVTYTGFK